jgi:serine/threonine protein kinase
VAAGLWHLHAERFVHRDLAARNLLLDVGAMRVKIADFGMSRVVRDLSHSLSSAEDRLVALKWNAPEVMQHGAYSPASDMFSFGVVLFEIWTTREPYEGLDNDEAAQRVVTQGLRPSLEPPAHASVDDQAHASAAAAASSLPHASSADSVAAPHALYAQVMRRCLGADVAPDSRITAQKAYEELEKLLALQRGTGGAGGSSASLCAVAASP